MYSCVYSSLIPKLPDLIQRTKLKQIGEPGNEAIYLGIMLGCLMIIIIISITFMVGFFVHAAVFIAKVKHTVM